MHKALREHILGITSLLSAYHQASKSVKNPSILGDLRERFLREFLSLYLPSSFDIVSGEVIDSTGSSSGQQDVIVYRRDVPRLRIVDGPSRFFIEGVKSTLEVKSKLTSRKFKDALDSVYTVKRLTPRLKPISNNLKGLKTGYVWSYVFAYEGLKSRTYDGLFKKYMEDKGWTPDDLYSYMPDAIYVLNGPLYYKNDGYVFEKLKNQEGAVPVFHREDGEKAALAFFTHLIVSMQYPDLIIVDWQSYVG